MICKKNKCIFIRYVVLLITTAVIVFIDQITKYLVAKNMELYDEIVVIPNFFNLFYVRNKGAGLGLFAQARWVFLTVTSIVIVGIIIILILNFFDNKIADIALVFILAGGIGNMIDRLLLGEVVDFFQFQIKLFDFIFNVADTFVTFGTVMLLFFYIFQYNKKSEKCVEQQSE